MNIRKRLLILTAAALVFTVTASTVFAAPPTKEAIEQWKADGTWDARVAAWKAFKAAGGCAAEEYLLRKDRHGDDMALGTNTVDTVWVPVIMVDFVDLPDSVGVPGTPEAFDSILFSDNHLNPTGSMTDYYFENSYGALVVKGDVFGWFRAPMDYEWYVGDDFGLTNGSSLAAHAVQLAETYSEIDFAKYDSDEDGAVDAVVIIHAGVGGEGAADGIWSHKSNIFPELDIDGVSISAYTMNPEETGNELTPIGVYCHEFGHILGLPDLYDIDYDPATSEGLGDWSIMASGSYNGSGKVPACFDAWCKISLGFVNPIFVEENLYQVEFPYVEDNPVVYLLKNDITTGIEYWLVENRQPVGFDAQLPHAGLCIYHCDMAAPGNTNNNRYMVAMEQADGDNALAYGGSQGDAGDTWPGATDNRNFHDQSVPDSRTNELGMIHGASSRIGVWNISDSDSLMTADLDIGWSRPWPVMATGDSILFDDSAPGGNGDGILDPGETIKFYCTMQNLMRTTYDARVSLTTGNPSVTFITDEVDLAAEFNLATHSTMIPIEFKLAGAFVPVIDSFFLTVVSDSLSGVPGGPSGAGYETTFGFEVSIGPPQVLIVDDDRGDDYQEAYRQGVYNQRIPYSIWNTATGGSPTGEYLAQHLMVFWNTGDSTVGALGADDIAAMKYYLDNGGNLLLSSISGANDIDGLDASFLSDYLGATFSGSSFAPAFYGIAGSEFGDGDKYRYKTVAPTASQMVLTPAGSGEGAFVIMGSSDVCGVTNRNGFNSIFVTFPLEYLADNFSSFDTPQDFFTDALAFFGGIPTGVFDGVTYAPLPRNFDLSQNYPNPFNPSTTISYTLRPTEGALPITNLSVFNLLGQKVATLVDEVQLPGTYSVVWDGTDGGSQQVATGVYFYRLGRGNDVESRKMILLK